jgi:predicted GH43/DUF377 family glycosyl hydrolase
VREVRKHPIAFKKDNFPVIDINNGIKKALSPMVLKIMEEKYKIFFAADSVKDQSCRTSIYSGYLKNNKDWILDVGERVTCFKGGAVNRVLAPSVRCLSNGYQMYFEGRSDGLKNNIFSAHSNDCIKWNISSTPIFTNNTNKYSYGTPFAITNSINNTLHLYFYRRSKNTFDIWCAISTDNGQIFSMLAKPALKQTYAYESYSVYSPFVLFANNLWHMYYAAWGGTPMKGRIFYAVSTDGIIWEKRTDPIIEPSIQYDILHCSEPSIIKINGKWKLFYEGCDLYGVWRILSCTEI